MEKIARGSSDSAKTVKLKRRRRKWTYGSVWGNSDCGVVISIFYYTGFRANCEKRDINVYILCRNDIPLRT